MPSIQIVLTDEEDRTLSELRVATTVPQRTRDRAHMLRLNAQDGPYLSLLKSLSVTSTRCGQPYDDGTGVRGLWEALGRGAKQNGKRLIYKLLNNGLSKTLAPTIVINWLRSYPSRGRSS